MKAALRGVRRLQLEALETRTLLAGGDFEESLAQVAPAIKGSGDFSVSFSERIGRSELFITGAFRGSVTVDFDLLPAWVTAVTVRYFDAVTFTGVDQLKKLVASDITTLSADKISVSVGLYATNVQSVSLATGGEITVLNGIASRIDVTDLRQTLIISDLQHLAIKSTSPNISIVSLNATQNVTLLYQPDLVSVAGLTDRAQQVKFLTAEETVTDSGNVVTVTPSERTSEFIARIRELLRTTGSGNPLSVFESLGYADMNLLAAPAPLSAHLHEHLERVDMEMAAPADVETELSGSPAPSLDLVEFDLSTLTELQMDTDFAVFGPDVDAGWLFDDAPVQTFLQPAGAPVDGLAASAPEANVTAEERAVLIQTIQSDTRTLRDLVIEGITGEITPGERTAFLLVDPKPARTAAERSREMSLWSDAVSRGETR
jgi:hypothetical protein